MLKRTSLGVLAGVLFMGTEGLGSLFLIRSLLQLTAESQASQFTVVTYLWLAFNVMGTSLGFVAARAAARLNRKSNLATLTAHAMQVGRWMLVPAVALAGAVVLALWVLGRLSPATGLAWVIFMGGHLVRLFGLIRVFVHVGDGHLGADKWYQLSCAALFYGTAIPAVHAGTSITGVAVLYAAATVLTAAGAHVWHTRLVSASAVHPVSVPADPPRSLARQSADMIAFSAAGFLAGNADAFVARWLLPDHDFVQYALAAKVGQVIALVAALVPSVLGPRITRLHQDGNHVLSTHTRRLALAAAIALATAGATTVILAGEPFARWISPTRHDVVTATLWIAALTAILQAWNLGLTHAINSVGGRGLVLATLASAVVAVLVAAILGNALGAPGIAMGTFAGSAVMLVAALTISRRTFRSTPAPTASASTDR